MTSQHLIQHAASEGYKSGLNWPDAWMSHGKPGGPWVPSTGSSLNREQALAENKAWIAGWEKGLSEKIASGRFNPLIGTENNARFHRQNLVELSNFFS